MTKAGAFPQLRRLSDPLAKRRLFHKLKSKVNAIWLYFSIQLIRIFAVVLGRDVHFIILTEHMGDIVACLPVAERLKRQNPDIFIVWVTNRKYSDIPRMSPHVSLVLGTSCMGAWSRIAHLVSAAPTTDLTFHRRECFYCEVLHSKKGSDHSVTLENYYDHGSLLEAFCKESGLPVTGLCETELVVPRWAADRVDSLNIPNRFVVFHCQSNETSRDWRDDGWNELVLEFDRSGIQVVEIGVGKSRLMARSNLTSLVSKQLSLPETAAVIFRADIFIGVDSGPAHLANALKVPGVILLGKYRKFRRYMPFFGRYAESEASRILFPKTGAAQNLTVFEVFTAAEELLRKAR